MGEVKEEFRELICKLTEEEYQSKSKELSRLIREKAALADAKAAETRHYNEEIAKAELAIQDLLPLIESGEEERQVECHIEFNIPKKGMKKIVRMDTGYSWTEEMTSDECQDMFLNSAEEAEEENEDDENGIPIPFEKAN